MAPKQVFVAKVTSSNKRKRLIVKENVEVQKKVMFDRGMFITLELAHRFNLDFTNKVLSQVGT